MENSKITLTIIIVLFSLFPAVNESFAQKNNNCISNGLIAGIPKSDLNKEEKAGLIQMREEEKLARDVYITLGNTWGIPIFSNISRAEQAHTDAVKSLLERYDIEDPVKDDAVGVFTSPELAKLYNDLVKKGNTSLMDAFMTGATIEDLDIKDLKDLINKTDNEDILVTYKNLNKGSRNHMRAFNRQISNRGSSYEPQFISEAEFENILSSPHERGFQK